MQKLLDSNGGATLTTGETSQILEFTDVAKVQFTIVGDISTGTLTLQHRVESGGTWHTFAPNGVSQTFTSATLSSSTATHTVTYEFGGGALRFSLATAGTLTVWWTGYHGRVMPA